MHSDPVVDVPQSEQPVAVAALVGERQLSASLLLRSDIEFQSEFFLELRIKLSLEAGRFSSDGQSKRLGQYLAVLN